MTIRSLFLVLVMIFSTGAAKAAGGIDLPVPRQTIPAGTEITHQDLIERSFPTRTAQQFAVSTNRGQLVGMVARRTLLPGQPYRSIRSKSRSLFVVVSRRDWFSVSRGW